VAALRRQNADIDADIAYDLTEQACEPLDYEFERIEYLLALRARKHRHRGGATMIQHELLADPKPPCNDTRRLIVGYASTDKPGVDVPNVRLRGRWLQDAGFVIGRYVKIEVGEGSLLIEQVD
jgi:type I toxin-antitoxin system toxin SymE